MTLAKNPVERLTVAQWSAFVFFGLIAAPPAVTFGALGIVGLFAQGYNATFWDRLVPAVVLAVPVSLLLLLLPYFASRNAARTAQVHIKLTEHFQGLWNRTRAETRLAKALVWAEYAAVTVLPLIALLAGQALLMGLVLLAFFWRVGYDWHLGARAAGAARDAHNANAAAHAEHADLFSMLLAVPTAAIEPGMIRTSGEMIGIHVERGLPRRAHEHDILNKFLATNAPQWMVHDSNARTLVLAPVTEQVAEEREIAQKYQNLVTAVRPLPDSPVYLHHAEWTLAPSLTTNRVGELENLALREGLNVVDLDLTRRIAEVAIMSAKSAEVRGRIALALKVAAWEIKLGANVAYGRLSEEDAPELLGVELVDVPWLSGDAAAREKKWLDLAQNTLGHAGWTVEIDEYTRRVSMKAGRLKRLPATVPLASMLPDRYSPTYWLTIPHGLSPEGTQLGATLTMPHGVVAGETGAGKTYFLLAHAAQALTRGHILMVVDPTKNGVDFSSLDPWITASALDDLVGAQALMEAIYRERERRQAILREHGVGNWAELSDQVKASENVRPLTVIIDEAASLLEKTKLSTMSALAPDHPYRVEAAETGMAKEIITMLLSKLGREARNVGIFIVVGLQRPDVEFLPGEFRANLGTKTQLKVPRSAPMAPETLRMFFPGQFAAEAAETLAQLDDGRPGFGAVMSEGGSGVSGIRVAYAHKDELPALLEQRGVPYASKWVVPLASTVASVGSYGQRKPPASDAPLPIVNVGSTDLGDWDLSSIPA